MDTREQVLHCMSGLQSELPYSNSNLTLRMQTSDDACPLQCSKLPSACPSETKHFHTLQPDLLMGGQSPCEAAHTWPSACP